MHNDQGKAIIPYTSPDSSSKCEEIGEGLVGYNSSKEPYLKHYSEKFRAARAAAKNIVLTLLSSMIFGKL
jgi:hypothetical protein